MKMKKSKMVKMIGKIIIGVLEVGVIVGIIALIENLVQWLCADTGRYLLGLIIGIYAIYKMLKKELG